MLRIKEKLAAGEVVRLFGLGQLASPKLVEMIGFHGGYDGFWIDQEHAGLTMRDVELCTLAANAHGLDQFVRLPATDYASVMRVLEAGANGCMFSMVRGVKDADKAVRWAKFPPRGERGLNGGNRDGRFGLEPLADYIVRANRETFVGIQIETPEAIAEVRDIAALDDVDCIFIGPADLSMILGVTGEFEHPKCLETIGEVARYCKELNKPWGIVARSASHAAKMHEMGCRLFVLGSDISSMFAGVRTIKQTYADLFE
jgi:2-dehydro-3-deoxyglucarate aldolase/4-hydroxy-2-oxoheptanedioate aldolase